VLESQVGFQIHFLGEENMRKIQILAASAVIFAVPGMASALYSTSFDNAGVASDFNVVSVASSADTVIFGDDYGARGIAEAPGTTGGAAATRGLFMQTNKGATGVINGINAYLTAGGVNSFTGDIVVRFDMWMNVPTPLTNTTEQALFGINTDGLGTNTRTGAAQTGADGVWYHLANEGGYGNTSSTPNSRDFVGYAGNSVSARLDNGEAPFTTLFPNGPLAGAPGNGWVRVEISESAGNVELKFNGTVISNFANGGFADGFLFLGYQDPFSGSLGSTSLFAVYDNLSVEAVPEPATMSVLALGALAAAARRRRKS
jgi:hypothetical protein